MLTKEQADFILLNFENLGKKEIARILNANYTELLHFYRDNQIVNNRYWRVCPSCNSKIYHKDIPNRIKSEKENKICLNCDSKLRKTKYSGQNNPFWGKTHSKEVKKNLSDKAKKSKRWKTNLIPFKKGQETLNKTPLYEIWLKKYGKDRADARLKEFCKKQSFNNSGEKNKMFGKPTPKGSGNGWSCYYKGIFFRSLNELSYFIQIIERFNLPWESAEKKKYKIPYLKDGKKRNYFADFLISNKYLVECKPKKLWNTIENKLKREAAINFCENRGWKYKIVEVQKISLNAIIELHQNKILFFLPKYEEKFKKYVEQQITHTNRNIGFR